jgi:hypothetical protein
MNRFESLVQETVELADQTYLQKTYNKNTDSYSLVYRENGRYSEPVEITHSIENERDADQLILAAEQNGITQLLEPGDKQ